MKIKVMEAMGLRRADRTTGEGVEGMDVVLRRARLRGRGDEAIAAHVCRMLDDPPAMAGGGARLLEPYTRAP